jgi:hypothetical protein
MIVGLFNTSIETLTAEDNVVSYDFSYDDVVAIAA